MILPARLKSIASIIDKGVNVIDVGCDHGLLDIYLTLYNDNNCIASDINENALSNALDNIKKYQVNIKTVISDGLKNIEVPTDSTVVISGMGATSILNIINDSKIDNVSTLIVQSNNQIELLRSEITKLGFYIVDEIAVFDRKKYYVIIKFKKGIKKYSNKDIMLGPILKHKNDIETINYYSYLINKKIIILKSIPNKHIIKKLKLLREIGILKRTKL